jgi:hypothetical protein
MIHGTRAYTGITGHGTARVVFTIFWQRNPDGSCPNMKKTKPKPIGLVTFLARGPTQLPS